MRRTAIGLALSGALLLAACGGGEAVDDSTAVTEALVTTVADTDPPPSVTEATATEATELETTTTSEAPEAPDDTASPASDPPTTGAPLAAAPTQDLDGACLVGEWVVTEDEMNAFYEGVTATLSVPLTMSVEGSAPITFNADHTYAWAPAFTLTVEVVGQVGTGISGGSIIGDWSAADGMLTTSAEVNALEVEVTVAGVTLDESDFANGLLNGSPVNGVTYSCDGPTPVLNFLTGDPDVTVPISLEPA
jgi:hypothetical protein